MTTLNQIYMNQLQKEITINENFQSTSISAIFSSRGNTGGLYYNYYGGKFKKDGGIVDSIADGSILLEDNTINYVYFDLTTGEVLNSTVDFPQQDYSIAKITTLNGIITDIEDHRYILLPPKGGIDTPYIARLQNSLQITTDTLTSLGISGSVDANTLYHLEVHVVYESDHQNNDLNLGFTSPIDSIAMLTVEVDGVKKLFPYDTDINTGNLVGGGVAVANSIRTGKIKGLLQVGNNAGTFDILGALAAPGDIITVQAALLFLVRVG